MPSPVLPPRPAPTQFLSGMRGETVDVVAQQTLDGLASQLAQMFDLGFDR